MYENQFQKIHQLLKDYRCEPTFKFEPEYTEHLILTGTFFYRSEELMHIDEIKAEWKEKVDARLDVCVPTRKEYSEKDLIRFIVEWSRKVKLYSMYISLPTSGRSKSLSSKTYKNQEEVITEIRKWLLKAGCSKTVKVDIQKPVTRNIEQMNLFEVSSL